MKCFKTQPAASKLIGALVLVAASSLTACNNSSGDTDGGSAVDNLGTGNTPVSDGGFGAKLTLTVDGVSSDQSPTIEVGAIKEFTVEAQDPKGQALQFKKVFCESELGVAIIEPSAGGVAFESTNRNGFMSGFVSCTTKGSFLMECRLDQGFNLVARQHIRCVGEGVANFPGAAGGHLGGGHLTGVSGSTGVSGVSADTAAASGATGATGVS